MHKNLASYANNDWDASMIVAMAHPQNTSYIHLGEVDLSASSICMTHLHWNVFSFLWKVILHDYHKYLFVFWN